MFGGQPRIDQIEPDEEAGRVAGQPFAAGLQQAAAGFDADDGLGAVEQAGETAGLDQGVDGGDGGVPAHAHFCGGSEPAEAEAGVRPGRRQDEGRLAGIDFASDQLHPLLAQVAGIEDYAGRVAGKRLGGEHVHQGEVEFHAGMLPPDGRRWLAASGAGERAWRMLGCGPACRVSRFQKTGYTLVRVLAAAGCARGGYRATRAGWARSAAEGASWPPKVR